MSVPHFHPNILIVTEGYTEKNYLKHLSERGAGYSIHVMKSPQEKAIKAVRTCAERFKSNFSKKDGDVAFCIVDVDNNSEKDLINAVRTAQKNGITLILSNPCFEIFFLMHFCSEFQMRMTPKETKEELKKYIPDYTETKDVWKLLNNKQKTALDRSRQFAVDTDDLSLKDLPNGTDLYLLFDKISEFKGPEA